jgi:hypothetical protein
MDFITSYFIIPKMNELMDEDDNNSIQSEDELDTLVGEMECLEIEVELDPYTYFDGPIETSAEEDEFRIIDDDGPV